MPRSQTTEEVQVLRFFEEAPLEKAETLFNIVKEKMRSRMGATPGKNGPPRKKERHLPSETEPKNTAPGTP